MRRRFLVGLLVFYAALMAVVVLGPQVLAKRTTNPTTSCTGTLTRATTSDITVPEGAICRVTNSTVNGSVTVHPGAYFEASGTTIYGNIQAAGALTVVLRAGTSVTGSVTLDGTSQLFVYETKVRGTVMVDNAVAPGFGHIQVCDSTAGQIQVRGSGPDVLIGDPQGGCGGNRVAGDVVVEGNTTMSELQVTGNTITGSLKVVHNTGPSPKQVANNTVAGEVEILGNSAPFVSTSN